MEVAALASTPVKDASAAQRFAAGLPARLHECRPAKVLEKSLSSGRLAHAILLHGEDLRELEAVALAMAGALLNSDAKDAARHPDYIALRPSGKARQIRIGERGDSAENTMRSFLRQISQTPNRGTRKLAVVYDADRMNIATANAFLKTLEEPPADTTLLLLSTRPYDLLDTIRSRCFHFRIDAQTAESRDERWQAWLASYSVWLGRVVAHPRKPDEVALAVVGLYALSQNFSDTLGAMSDENWEREKESLPPNLPDEQVSAMEAGSRKGLRQLMFAEVEAETLSFVRKSIEPSKLPSLFLVHESMERAARLCDVFNLKEDAALEAFLLNSMRAWARA
jgi:DNA polymerase III subunit delta'